MKKKKDVVEPRAKRSFGPFSEPRTIPAKWDVSELAAPAQALTLKAALVLPETLLQLLESIDEDSEVSI